MDETSGATLKLAAGLSPEALEAIAELELGFDWRAPPAGKRLRHRSAPWRNGGYTHGHHESVLRSHRWRTAENSVGVDRDAGVLAEARSRLDSRQIPGVELRTADAYALEFGEGSFDVVHGELIARR